VFDEFNGLPMHPLVVHAAVVFVPLLCLLAVVYAVVPRVRLMVGWAAAALAVGAPIAAWVATRSGAALAETRYADQIPPAVQDHQQYGDRAMYASIALGLRGRGAARRGHGLVRVPHRRLGSQFGLGQLSDAGLPPGSKEQPRAEQAAQDQHDRARDHPDAQCQRAGAALGLIERGEVLLGHRSWGGGLHDRGRPPAGGRRLGWRRAGVRHRGPGVGVRRCLARAGPRARAGLAPTGGRVLRAPPAWIVGRGRQPGRRRGLGLGVRRLRRAARAAPDGVVVVPAAGGRHG
jgi:hypothetical protein